MEKVDVRIAISMAILAGLLAIISLFANLSSGAMVSYQTKANNLQAQANMARTKATDLWSFFQAKVLRKHMYSISSDMLYSLNTEAQLQRDWKRTERRYTAEASELKEKATLLDREADILQKEANVALELSVKENRKGDVLDLSRLCSEIGLVLCSIALVSRRRFLWVIGVTFGMAACGIYCFVVVYLW